MTERYELCPIKKDLCPMLPVCDLKQYTGSTYCVEWIKLQQQPPKPKKGVAP